jgi:AraC family transcriptional regulator
MLSQSLVADRGAAVDLDTRADAARWLVVAHAGSLHHHGLGVSVWIQLRGATRVTAREGRFDLRRGDWLVLDRDSFPELQADREGLTLGLVYSPQALRQKWCNELLPGLGRMRVADLRIALRLWRNGAMPGSGHASRGHAPRDGAPHDRALQAATAHLASLQHEYDATIARCPGRSIARKRQVFMRLQRARLFLQGHCDRVARLGELAALTHFSSWYLSKTFHEIYGESPQSASVRLRLERACELLAASDCSIGEVGVACGFDNSCSFARAFRARYGATASDYRHACAHAGVSAMAGDRIALARASTHARIASVVDEMDASKRDFVANDKVGTTCEPKRTRDPHSDAVLCFMS